MTDLVQPGNWDDALHQAFAILLGRPLKEFPDAAYAAYFDACDLGIELFEEGFGLEPLARGEIVQPPFLAIPELGRILQGADLIMPYWSIDLGRSIFKASDINSGASLGVPELDSPIAGRDLGRILIERGLTPRDVSKTYPDIQFRAHTDGSLFDAMRFVTGTHPGPDHLLRCDPDSGIDPGWEEKLAAIAHPLLRDALRHLCRDAHTARAYGAHYSGAKNPWFKDHRQVIAAWGFGEGQGWSAVVQLP
jgi:hypothetical protein